MSFKQLLFIRRLHRSSILQTIGELNMNKCDKCTDGFIEILMDGKLVKVICDWCQWYSDHGEVMK